MTEPASEEPSRSDTTCAAPGCPKEAHLKCSRCQTVRYCSKACQVTHWKAGHAKACRAKTAAPAPPPEEDALARQDRLLRESPRADYVVEVDKATELWRLSGCRTGYCLGSPRKPQQKVPRSLYLMNDILAKAQPERGTHPAAATGESASTLRM